MRETVAAHRAEHAREVARRHVPRVLLSDGTDAEVALVEPVEGDLRGSPASPGVVTGRARVIRSPNGAHIEPGEIFGRALDRSPLDAALSHRRRIGDGDGRDDVPWCCGRPRIRIPAVVRVAGATERIVTGELITVDGTAGVVSIARTRLSDARRSDGHAIRLSVARASVATDGTAEACLDPRPGPGAID